MGLIKALWRSESTSERIGTVVQWVGWKLFHHFVYRPAKHIYAIVHRVYRILRYLYLVFAWGYTKYEARAKVQKEKEEAEEKARQSDEKEQQADEEMDRKLNRAMNDKKGTSENFEKEHFTSQSSPLKGSKIHHEGLKRRPGVNDSESAHVPLRDM